MKFAYADPPYLGCGSLYLKHHARALEWNDPATHRRLIERLVDEYPDGWAMSLSSPSLATILPMCPSDCRVSPWVKPFAVFKPNVGVAYAWEAVIWRGGRKRTREQQTVRDWHSANISVEKGLTGAKPPSFCFWLFELLNAQPSDEFDDIFPGTRVVGRCWVDFRTRHEERQLVLCGDHPQHLTAHIDGERIEYSPGSVMGFEWLDIK